MIHQGICTFEARIPRADMWRGNGARSRFVREASQLLQIGVTFNFREIEHGYSQMSGGGIYERLVIEVTDMTDMYYERRYREAMEEIARKYPRKPQPQQATYDDVGEIDGWGLR